MDSLMMGRWPAGTCSRTASARAERVRAARAPTTTQTARYWLVRATVPAGTASGDPPFDHPAD